MMPQQPFESFITKAIKLERSTFVQKLMQQSGWNITLKKDNNPQVRRCGPDQEAIDSFVLSFRFFIQSNEPISFRSMHDSFAQQQIPKDLMIKFKEEINDLNTFLDSPSTCVIQEPISNRKLMDTIIYGELSHNNPKKKKLFDQWCQNPFALPLIMNEFCLVMLKVLAAISFIKTLCENALNQNSEQ